MDSGGTTIGSAYDESNPDTFIGPYKLVRQIGEGGMGIVYHAHQTEPIRRDVALKVIKPGMDTKQVIARFETERQALAVMDHPHVAHVFDAGTTSTGRPYFVMELVDGMAITQYCDSKRLSIRERVELFILVCGAIQHAHQKGIIHRDIKPSNVLVAEHEGKPVPKVIDFGLSKALGQQLSDASMMTNAGVVVGTPDYMSPEQAELTRRDVDTRTDVYSLGAVLYELLTGTTPLRRERLQDAGLVDVLQKIRMEEPEAPSTRLRESETAVEIAELRRCDPSRLPKLLHGELDWITIKALAKNRAERYETVSNLARDLERYLQGEPVEAGPLSTSYRIREFAVKHRGLIVTAGAFALLLIAASVVSTWLAVRASRAERAANQGAQAKDRIAEFMKDLFRVSDPSRTRGNSVTAREILDSGVEKIHQTLTDQPEIRGELISTMGNVYEQLGLYADAERLQREVFDLWRQLRGPDYLASLKAESRIGYLASRQGRNDEAETLLKDAAQRLDRTAGKESADTIVAKSNLGFVYRRQGRLDQAATVFQDLVQLEKQVFGEDAPQTLADLNNLSIVYADQRRADELVKIQNEILDIRRRRLGEDHPLTLTSMNNLANGYRLVGRLDDARSLLEHAIYITERVLGSKHPEYGIYINSLGEVEFEQGKLASAEEHLKRAKEVYERQNGSEYLGLVTYELAEVSARQSKTAQALDYLAAALK